MNFNDARKKVSRAVFDNDKIETVRSRHFPNSHIWELITTFPIYQAVLEKLLNDLTNNDEIAYDLKFERIDSKPGVGVRYRYKIQLRLATQEPEDVEGWGDV